VILVKTSNTRLERKDHQSEATCIRSHQPFMNPSRSNWAPTFANIPANPTFVTRLFEKVVSLQKVCGGLPLVPWWQSLPSTVSVANPIPSPTAILLQMLLQLAGILRRDSRTLDESCKASERGNDFFFRHVRLLKTQYLHGNLAYWNLKFDQTQIQKTA